MQELKIKAWFNQKTIFVTGGTGFLGKVLIEKLLHDCLSLNKIYVLIRADDQFELFERFIKFKSNKIFDRIREIDENLLNKLTPIKGDLSKLNLNLSDRDKSILINECNIIIHGGASVKFDIKLNDIILLNVRGTRELCLLSKNCKNLKSFIYISTAFSNCNEKKKIYEKIYPTIFEPNFVIDLCERNCEEHLLKDILKIYPNTYIFSKNLAEKLLYDMHEDLPCGIVRPSIITPSVKDPYSGWVDSRNGPMGYILGAGSGLIRSAHGCYHAVADLLPVDFAANATIAVACNVGQFKISKCPIYNLSTSSDAPLTWRSVLDLGKEIILKNPLPNMLWYPGGSMHYLYIIHFISFIILQLIPAILCDILMLIINRPPWLIRFQLKIFKNLQLFSYFLGRTWFWDTTNTNSLYYKMSLEERYIFNFKSINIDYWKYFENWHCGTRKYLLKIDEFANTSTLKKLQIFYYLEMIRKFLFYLIISYIFYKIFNEHYSMPAVAHLGSCGSCNQMYHSLKSSSFSI